LILSEGTAYRSIALILGRKIMGGTLTVTFRQCDKERKIILLVRQMRLDFRQ
jgi:hypothetical protein